MTAGSIIGFGILAVLGLFVLYVLSFVVRRMIQAVTKKSAFSREELERAKATINGNVEQIEQGKRENTEDLLRARNNPNINVPIGVFTFLAWPALVFFNSIVLVQALALCVPDTGSDVSIPYMGDFSGLSIALAIIVSLAEAVFANVVTDTQSKPGKIGLYFLIAVAVMFESFGAYYRTKLMPVLGTTTAPSMGEAGALVAGLIGVMAPAGEMIASFFAYKWLIMPFHMNFFRNVRSIGLWMLNGIYRIMYGADPDQGQIVSDATIFIRAADPTSQGIEKKAQSLADQIVSLSSDVKQISAEVRGYEPATIVVNPDTTVKPVMSMAEVDIDALKLVDGLPVAMKTRIDNTPYRVACRDYLLDLKQNIKSTIARIADKKKKKVEEREKVLQGLRYIQAVRSGNWKDSPKGGKPTAAMLRSQSRKANSTCEALSRQVSDLLRECLITLNKLNLFTDGISAADSDRDRAKIATAATIRIRLGTVDEDGNPTVKQPKATVLAMITGFEETLGDVSGDIASAEVALQGLDDRISCAKNPNGCEGCPTCPDYERAAKDKYDKYERDADELIRRLTAAMGSVDREMGKTTPLRWFFRPRLAKRSAGKG